MRVSEDKEQLLQLILIEYSKIDFKDYCNLKVLLQDVAFIKLDIPYAELRATVIIKKCKVVKNFQKDKPAAEHTEFYNVIDKVEVIESRIIMNGDVLEVSSFRLSAAHEEQLYKHI